METYGPKRLQGPFRRSQVGAQHLLLGEHTYQVSARLTMFAPVAATTRVFVGIRQVDLVSFGIWPALVQHVEDTVAGRCYFVVRSFGDLEFNVEFIERILREKVTLLDPFSQGPLPQEELLSLPLKDLVHHAIRRVHSGRHKHTVGTLDNVTCFVSMSGSTIVVE